MTRDDHVGEAPICLGCGEPASLKGGHEVRPGLSVVAGRAYWACRSCPDTYVTCHEGTAVAMGLPADRALRQARSALHADALDPLWLNAPSEARYRHVRSAGIVDRIRRRARSRVYAWLADRMDLCEEECHVGMFDVVQCEEARRHLSGTSYDEIRSWARRIEWATEIVARHERRVEPEGMAVAA